MASAPPTDAHRNPWQQAAVKDLVARSWDAVVVEIGVRVNLAAAAELLRGSSFATTSR